MNNDRLYIYMINKCITKINIENIGQVYYKDITDHTFLKYKKITKQSKDIVVTFQNENLIIRNIDIINPRYKKDIFGLLKYQLKDTYNVDTKEYIIKYKIINKTTKSINIQVTLIKKDIMKKYIEILNKLKVSTLKVYPTYDILQGLIYKNKIGKFDKNGIIIYEDKEEFQITFIKENNIIDCYNISKLYVSRNYFNEVINSNDNIYVYGNLDDIYRYIDIDSTIPLEITDRKYKGRNVNVGIAI